MARYISRDNSEDRLREHITIRHLESGSDNFGPRRERIGIRRERDHSPEAVHIRAFDDERERATPRPEYVHIRAENAERERERFRPEPVRIRVNNYVPQREAFRVRRRDDPEIATAGRIFENVHIRSRDVNIRRHVTREVPMPEGHDITVDYFLSGRGMRDHDRLLQENQEEARQRDARIRERMMAEELTDQHRINAARDELERLRQQMREDSRRGDPEPSSRREKSRTREEPKEECCERLLRFLREESEVQARRWRETRVWQELVVQRLIESGASEEQAGGTSSTPQATTRIYNRPPSLGWPVNGRIKRRVQIGFMFLAKGTPTQSRRLLQYDSGYTVLHDIWLIERMSRFYTNVARSRWVPQLRKLALAKFVRASSLLFE